jgi:signal transduction histidine kinase
MINPENTKIELNVRSIRTFLPGFEDLYGKKELIKFIEGTGMPLDYFNDENNWISFDYYCKVLNALVDYTGGTDIPYKFGLSAGKSKSWGIIKTIITSFTTCAFTYKTVISLSPRWTKVGKFRFINLKKNSAILELRLRDDLKQVKNNCLLGVQSQLASIPTYYNLPPAKIREIQCAAEGADSCIYDISWRNPPYKKTGLYFLLAGIFISFMLYQLTQNKIITLSFVHLFVLINLPFACWSLWKILNNKKRLKDSYEKTEEQNELLTGHLEDIEKVNEFLQKKVQERTKELINSSKEIEKKIADLKNNEDELIRSEKTALVGALSDEIANKLKKPLDKIQKILTEIIKETPASNPVNNSLTSAQRAANRCEKIINELLYFSHSGNHLYPLKIDMNKIIEECVIKLYEEISNPDIKIEINLSNELPKISADYNQIKQVMMIFLTNANDAINEINKNNKKNEGKFSISTLLKDKDILVEIKDTGCGIPKDVISKIFDPFFSTKTTSKRKGMGLTLSYNIIKQLGGRIEVESIPNEGTTFKIYMPVSWLKKPDNII